ncbi:hypothetical protein KEM55_009174 [Ascosphaera atra]|nr:hypothetical protein KEM55_009174 [Ascosphaera atra]
MIDLVLALFICVVLRGAGVKEVNVASTHIKIELRVHAFKPLRLNVQDVKGTGFAVAFVEQSPPAVNVEEGEDEKGNAADSGE